MPVDMMIVGNLSSDENDIMPDIVGNMAGHGGFVNI